MKSSRTYLTVSLVCLLSFVFGVYLLATARDAFYIVGGYFTILGALFGIIGFLEYGAAKDYENWERRYARK